MLNLGEGFHRKGSSHISIVCWNTTGERASGHDVWVCVEMVCFEGESFRYVLGLSETVWTLISSEVEAMWVNDCPIAVLFKLMFLLSV